MIVDLDKAVELVDKVIADAAKQGIRYYEKPEGGSGYFYVHRFREDGGFVGCNPDGEVATVKPGCIVGRVVIELGVPMDRIEFKDEGYFSRLSGLGYKLKNEFGIEFADDAYEFLHELQVRQDGGASWVPARDRALKSVREYS